MPPGKKFPLDMDSHPEAATKALRDISMGLVKTAVKIYQRDGYLLPLTFVFDMDGETHMIRRHNFGNPKTAYKFTQAYAYTYKPAAIFLLSEGMVNSEAVDTDDVTAKVRELLERLAGGKRDGRKAIVGLLQSKYVNFAVEVTLVRVGDVLTPSEPVVTELNKDSELGIISNVVLQPWWPEGAKLGGVVPLPPELIPSTDTGRDGWLNDAAKLQAEEAARAGTAPDPTEVEIPRATPNLIPCPACHGTMMNPKLQADGTTDETATTGQCPLCENGYIEVPS